jgi:hypothetical protein
MAELVASAGAARFLMAPVAPGSAAFPEPWAPTLGGVSAVLRRLAWHAGEGRAIELRDERVGAPPTERKPQTSVEALLVRPKAIVFAVRFVGEDDVAGTLAHEIGVAFAAVHRPAGASPYREAETGATEVEIDPHRDLARGSLATVYLGLGVLAANAAFQQYSRSRGAYQPLEYDVLAAGYAPLSELAYLLAVQAVVRGEAQPPPGLVGPARDETAAWISALLADARALRAALGFGADAVGADASGADAGGADAGGADARALRAALGIGADAGGADAGGANAGGADAGGADAGGAARSAVGAARPAVGAARPAVVPFADVDVTVGPPAKRAFRWQAHRTGMGTLAGVVLGAGVALLVGGRGVPVALLVGGVTVGHAVGRRVKVARCSACVGVVPLAAETCRHCGAALRGDIASLAERLDAEEALAELPPT